MDYTTTDTPAETPDGNKPQDNSTRAGTRRLFIALAVLLSIVGLDRVAKYVAQDVLLTSPPISVWGDFVRFEYAENTGAFLSLGSGLPDTLRFALLGVMVTVVLVLILVYMFRKRSMHPAELLALALIAGGGIGNLIDRLTAGYVIDFVSMGFDGLRTGIFNVADVAISGGLILYFFMRLRPARTAAEAPDTSPSQSV